MPKELFNGTLITSPSEPDDLDRVTMGQPSVQGSKNFTWARFKEIVAGLAASFKTLSDVDVPTFAGQDKKKLTIDEATGKIIATPSTTASGFYDRTAFTISFDGVNLNLTGTIKFVTVDEKEIIKTNDSIALTLTNKLIYVYYDNNGALQQEFNLNRIRQEQRMKETLPVSYITNNITTQQLTFVGDYRKGRSENSLWVKNFFDKQVYSLSGIDVFDLTKGSGAVDADARFGLTAGQLLFTDAIYPTPTRQAVDIWNVGYFDPNLDPLGVVGNAFPMLTDKNLGIGDTGLVVYNNDGAVTAATSGKLVWYFVLETVDITPADRTLSFMGNGVYGNIAEAESALANERATLEYRLVVRQGAKVRYGILIETKSTFANVPKARIIDIYSVEEEAGGTPTISFPLELVNSLYVKKISGFFRNIANTFSGFFNWESLTADRTITWQDKNITVAGLDDIPIIDSSLSNISENPVQNKVITAKTDSLSTRVTVLEGQSASRCQTPIASVDVSDNVTLTSNPSFADIHYTTDGNRPTFASTIYSVPFNITASTQVRAIARALGYIDSAELDTSVIPSGFPIGITGRLFHFDFTDETTLTLNGSNVSAANDLSGNGYNLQQTNAAAQPAYITGDGVKRVRMVTLKSLISAATPPSYTGAFSIFILARITSTLATGRDKIIGLNTGTFNNVFIQGRTVLTDVYKSVTLITSNLDVDKTLSIDDGIDRVSAFIQDTDFKNVTNKIHDIITSQSNVVINDLLIGGMTSGSTADIYEIVAYNRALTLTESQNVAQYMYNRLSINLEHWTVFGDSIANGTAASTSYGFAMMVINNYKGLRYNLAVSGTSSQFALQQVNDNFNNLPLDNVLIEVGSNETAAETGTWLPQVIDRLIERGYTPSKIYVLSLPYRSTDGQKTIDHENVCLNLQSTRGITYIDVHTPMLAAGGDSLIADGIHPTTEGHRVMADTVISVINA